MIGTVMLFLSVWIIGILVGTVINYGFWNGIYQEEDDENGEEEKGSPEDR